MAYSTGLLMADCAVCANPYGQTEIALSLKADDIELVEFIRNEISPTRPVQKFIQRIYPTVRIRFRSNIIAADLANLGIISRRTGKETLPTIPIKYQRHFLRGLIDGDGSIAYKNRNRLSLESASQTFLLSIKEKLGNNYGRVIRQKNKNCCTWTVEKLEHLNDLYHYLYDDGGFYLKRKKENFEKVVEYYKNSRVYRPGVLTV